ncbi:15860_t:CDS:2, partial [Entrophospora sp. SA101]
MRISSVHGISGDELNDSEKTISSEDLEDEHNISHTNKTVNPEWFKSYSWLGVENLNEETIIYCKICRNRNGKTKFAREEGVLLYPRRVGWETSIEQNGRQYYTCITEGNEN